MMGKVLSIDWHPLSFSGKVKGTQFGGGPPKQRPAGYLSPGSRWPGQWTTLSAPCGLSLQDGHLGAQRVLKGGKVPRAEMSFQNPASQPRHTMGGRKYIAL